MALRLRPDYPEVVNMLTSRKRIKIKRYVVHTIKPGESLSKVAGMYYGDHQKFPIIAKYNNLTDATRVHEGQKIKVPEIEGLEFLVGRKSVETEETGVDYSGPWDWEAFSEGESGVKGPQEEQEPDEQIVIYRDHGIDLYRKKQYQEALIALNLALNIEPDDKTTLEYAHKSHFESAKALFDIVFYCKDDAIINLNKWLQELPHILATIGEVNVTAPEPLSVACSTGGL